MRLLAAVLLAWALLAGPALAQQQLIGGLIQGTLVTYTGPGDVVSGATAWYGLRAYNAAYATGSNKAINIRCISGSNASNTYDILIKTTGALDIATASSDCGTDGTVTASQSTTVLTITALLTGQVTIGDQLTGTGLTGPEYVTSAGTCTSGAVVATCTFNVSKSQTVSSTTITAAAGMAVTEAYDQTGNNVNEIQNTASNQPYLLTSCNSSKPCIYFPGSSNHCLISSNTESSTNNWSAAGAVNYVSLGGTLTSLQVAFQNEMGAGSTAGNLDIDGNNTFIIVSGSAATWYAEVGTSTGTTSSAFISGNGSSTTGTTGNVTATSATGWGCRTNGNNATNAYSEEVGHWASKIFSSTQGSNLTTNIRNYWGF